MRCRGSICVLILGLTLVGAAGARAQVALPLVSAEFVLPVMTSVAGLPDSPGAVLLRRNEADFGTTQNPGLSAADPQSPCEQVTAKGVPARTPAEQEAVSAAHLAATGKPCPRPQNPYKPFVVSPVKPLTPRQKGRLAFRDVSDPFNLLTAAGNSAYFIGSTPHNPYGPGMKGFGYNLGVTLSQDATGEAIGTFAVCSLFHEDPRYFRMPHASIPRRVLHAVVRVVVAQADDGHTIPNYANLITSPASAFISNQYVPGIATDMASTVDRIFSGFLTEPIGTLIAEFLPDVASHIHVRIVLVQNILNKISATPPAQSQGQGGAGAP